MKRSCKNSDGKKAKRNDSEICASVRRCRREPRIDSPREKPITINPRKGRFCAERILPTLERTKIEKGNKLGFPQGRETRDHCQKKKCESGDDEKRECRTCFAGLGEILTESKCAQSWQSHDPGFSIGQHNCRKCRCGCERSDRRGCPHKVQHAKKRPWQKSKRTDDNKMLELHGPGQQRRGQNEQHASNHPAPDILRVSPQECSHTEGSHAKANHGRNLRSDQKSQRH